MWTWLAKLLDSKEPLGMTDEQAEIVRDIEAGLRHLMEVGKGAEQPTRGILSAQIFILIGKCKYLLGEK